MNQQHQYHDRFKVILSDPLNSQIEKIPESGKLENGIITMYNGVKIRQNSYYGNFSDILIMNEGIHEPSEEFLFQKVIKHISTTQKKPLMVELGSYWAFYSLSLLQVCPEATTYCIEAGEHELLCGVSNFGLNDRIGWWGKEFVGNGENELKLTDFVKQQEIEKIDILHSDIQGKEHEMLIGAEHLFRNKKIEFAFISTHTPELHSDCLATLRDYGYEILAEVGMEDTFCEDGIILAAPTLLPELAGELPRRRQTLIISDLVMDSYYKKLV